jgi:hypothetical protein
MVWTSAPRIHLTSAQDGGGWSALRLDRFTLEARASGALRGPQIRSERGGEEK